MRLKEKWWEEDDEPWEPENEPIITPMLRSVSGGISRILECLRAYDDEDAKGFIGCYDSISPTDRKHLSPEAIAFAAGIGSLRLAELAQTALFLYASMQTKMLISGAMPKVTKAIIKAATDEVPIVAYTPAGRLVVGKTNGDVKAMELFGRISGIAPVPKGAQIAIQNNYGEREEKSAAPAWRSAEERLREIQDATEPKRLPSPVTTPINIGGHIDRLQEDTVHIIRGE